MASAVTIVGNPISRRTAGLLAFAAAVALTWLVPDFRLYQLAGAGVLAVAAVGVTILSGRCGQLSLGHGAFIGVGAYTAALLVRDVGAPYPVAVTGAAVVCFALGVVVGVPAVLLPVNGLAVVTLTGALALPQVIKKYDGLTGGPYGVFLPSAAQLHSPWDAVSDDQFTYLVVLVAVALAVVVGSNLARGRWGLAMMAVRDHPVAAASMGVDVPRTKVAAFATSAAFAGAAGGLHIALVGSITPNDLALTVSFTLVVGAVIGGLGSVPGAVLGTLFVVLLPTFTSGWTPAAPGLAIGAITVAVVLLAPTGLAGVATRLRGATGTIGVRPRP